MSDQTITSLIEKLEGAEVGSRELDGAVWYAVHEPDVEHGFLHVEQTEQGPMEVLTCELGSKFADCVGSYTTSLDAALALAERVLTMGTWDVGYTYNSDRPHYARLVIVRDDEGQPEIYGRAATPALALCAAILRAQSEARV